MRTPNIFLPLSASLLLGLSTSSAAEGKPYQNFYQATHINAGWIAYTNGELYQCRFSAADSKKAPHCIKATGLPSSIQTVSLLSAVADIAWVSYTNGQVYGCHSQRGKAPRCLAADGLP